MENKAIENNIQNNQELLGIFDLEKEKLIPLAFLGITTGSILHDLSNPLSLLLLDKRDVKDDLSAYYRTIRSIMRNNYALEELDLKEILEDVLIIFKEKSKRYNCKIHAIYPKQIFIKGLRNGLYNIFLNLISNACESHKDNQSGYKDVWIIIKKKRKHLLIEIIDNGCGIPKAVQEKIFEPFFSTKNGENAGLGLSLIKYYIEIIHKGSIEIDSEVAKGSRFIITFPLT